MGQYLAWNIPRTRKFKFVQIKSLGSQMATVLYRSIYIVSRTFKNLLTN